MPCYFRLRAVADPTLAAYPAVALRPGPDGEPRDKVRPRDASRTGRILERAHIEIRQELDDRQAGLGSLGESIEDRRHLIVEKVASLRTISRHHPATLRACACDAGAKTTS